MSPHDNQSAISATPHTCALRDGLLSLTDKARLSEAKSEVLNASLCLSMTGSRMPDEKGWYLAQAERLLTAKNTCREIERSVGLGPDTFCQACEIREQHYSRPFEQARFDPNALDDDDGDDGDADPQPPDSDESGDSAAENDDCDTKESVSPGT